MLSSFWKARPVSTAGAPFGFDAWREGCEDDDGNAAAATLINTTPFFTHPTNHKPRVFSKQASVSVELLPARRFVTLAQQLDAEGVLALKLLDA